MLRNRRVDSLCATEVPRALVVAAAASAVGAAGAWRRWRLGPWGWGGALHGLQLRTSFGAALHTRLRLRCSLCCVSELVAQGVAAHIGSAHSWYPLLGAPGVLSEEAYACDV